MHAARDIQIELAPHEFEMAAHVGIRRQTEAMGKKLRDRHGMSGDPVTIHIQGAAGEMAVAKALGLYWDGSVNTFHASADVGQIHVRTRSGETKGGKVCQDLILRPCDDDGVYVLVVGTPGRSNVFRVAGWCKSAEMRRDKYSADHGGRPTAWFIPPSDLRAFPIEEAA